jgi:hypothetical protein
MVNPPLPEKSKENLVTNCSQETNASAEILSLLFSISFLCVWLKFLVLSTPQGLLASREIKLESSLADLPASERALHVNEQSIISFLIPIGCMRKGLLELRNRLSVHKS